ncbi:TerC family protein [Calderihabitans maritimus]|uniref:Integral membrane protein TerC n=1 Tax=Calderihabitans maritimus TaxID=1246530 RepID=A0A1Z5HRY5_9FIRM|nr:TerC family protein [Calderihabitans maritimus]GAW92286.1 hypothetical protein C176_20344 [Calderihabitans maritimus]
MDLILPVLSIIMIDLVLSGDNAVVIAMACRLLPEKDRKKAIYLGTFGAVFLRVILATVAIQLLRVSFLRLIGGLLLLVIALKLLREEKEEKEVDAASNLFQAIKIIIAADFVMSLDNVLGIAGAARGHVGLLVFGLSLSIPIVIFGSRVLLALMERFPIIIQAGAAVLAWTAGEMIVSEQFISHWVENQIPEWLVPLTAIILVLGIGQLLRQKEVRRIENSLSGDER